MHKGLGPKVKETKVIPQDLEKLDDTMLPSYVAEFNPIKDIERKHSLPDKSSMSEDHGKSISGGYSYTPASLSMIYGDEKSSDDGSILSYEGEFLHEFDIKIKMSDDNNCMLGSHSSESPEEKG
ncbi:MAG: hypothetical protein KA998_04230 [Rickettsiaceae bacterium]|nr:hypothetical protein [Rickettsiaceae bacterium]